jgi:beta-lactamase regulating signal transducer with metallopeptidase domain
MHLLHPVCFVVLGIWGALLGLRVVRSGRAQRTLERVSRPARIGGVECRIIRGDRDDAFVLGGLRPRIYIGERVLARLDRAELDAVLLHEEHHRLTSAPLRSAALDAWLCLAGWFPPFAAQLRARLAELETGADRFALAQGVTPRTIAGALLKTQPTTGRASFAGIAEPRIRWLVAAARGAPPPGRSLPWEWLPAVASLYMLATCLLVSLLRSLQL